ncbi:MAG: TrkA C-terminal domain-containing protein [Nitrososphaerota archaeon]
MKDTSELMLDLAFSTILFEEDYFAEEVLELEEKMTELCFKAREVVMLASRGIKEVESLSAVLQIIQAAEKVSNAAVDIATIELRDIGLPKAFFKTMHLIEETITSLVVPENSAGIGKQLDYVERETGMQIITMKRDGQWLIKPEGKIALKAGDRLIAKGPFEALSNFEVFILGKHVMVPSVSELMEPESQRKIREILVEMMNLSQLSVDLAYSSAIFYNREIAGEVSKVEERMDHMQEAVEHEILLFAKVTDNVKLLRGLLRLAWALESITDASVEMASVVQSGVALHPVFISAMEESDEVISKIEVKPDSRLDGLTVMECGLQSDMGIQIVTIRKARMGKWEYHPKGDTRIEAGDVLIMKGSKEAISSLIGLTTTESTPNESGQV